MQSNNYNNLIYNEVVENILSQKLNFYEAKDKLCIILERYNVQKQEVNPYNHDLKTNIQLYIEDKTMQNLSKYTIYGYKLQLNKFLKHISIKIQDITKEEILQYFEFIKTENPNVNSSTLETVRYILQAFFNWLKDEHKIDVSPMERIRPFKVDKKIGNALNIRELEIVRDNCKTLRQKALLEFSYATGLRLSEIVSVNIEDIDWINRRLITKGKGNKERYVFISPKCVVHLEKYLKSREDDCKALFVTERKPYRRLGNRAIEREIGKVGKCAESTIKLSPHCLRRSLISNLVAKNCPLPVVQQIAGHSSLSTTQKYISISQEFKQQSYNQYLYQ